MTPCPRLDPGLELGIEAPALTDPNYGHFILVTALLRYNLYTKQFSHFGEPFSALRYIHRYAQQSSQSLLKHVHPLKAYT